MKYLPLFFIFMWKIGNIEIKGRIVLGPMAGYTSEGYRKYMNSFGCDLCVTEMVSDMGILYENEEKLNTAYRLLDDNRSKDVFAGYIGFQFSGELPILDSITTDEDEAWSSLSLGAGETFVDIGAYRGDTVEKFLSFCGGNH